MKITYNLNSPGMPYKDEAANRIYEMLFCDNEDLYRPDKKFLTGYPWSVIYSNEYKPEELKKITIDDKNESRLKLLAYNKLRSNGNKVLEKELLGVIIEVGLDSGLDVLAAYRDGTARYINYSEKMIFWESPSADSNNITDKLFKESEITLRQIGPWDKARPGFPAKGTIRISFLVSDGLYFGQGSDDNFFNDELSAPILKYGNKLMNFLIDKSLSKR